MLLFRRLNNAQDLFLNVPVVRQSWLFLDFVKIIGNPDNSLLPVKACSSFKTGGKHFYGIVVFLKPIYRSMYPLALKKMRFLKTDLLPLIQKKIFSYIQSTQPLPGLFNHRIRSWFAALTQSILV